MPPSPLSDSRPPLSEESLRYARDEGAIRLPDGQRVAAVPGDFIWNLHRDLAQQLGEQARHVLYEIGYEWGLQDLARLSHQIHGESAGGNRPDIWQMDARVILDRWWAPLGAAGWGAWTLDLSAHPQGLASIELRQSAAVLPSARASEPVCHLYAGLFAGALSFFERAERHTVQTECVALGHPCCRFIVGPGPVIDQAETVRRQGAAHDAILRAILDADSAKSSGPAAPKPAPAKPGQIPWKK